MYICDIIFENIDSFILFINNINSLKHKLHIKKKKKRREGDNAVTHRHLLVSLEILQTRISEQ